MSNTTNNMSEISELIAYFEMAHQVLGYGPEQDSKEHQTARLLRMVEAHCKAQEAKIRELQRNFCELQADYAWETGAGSTDEREIAEIFGWDCYPTA